MFYIFNQSGLPVTYEPHTQAKDVYKLQECLSIALRRNILAFKATNTRIETEPGISEKELSISGTHLLEDKVEKTDLKIESNTQAKIKTDKKPKETSKSKLLEKVIKKQNNDKNGMFCEKRRIIRSLKEVELPKIEKSSEKKIKVIIDAKNDFTTLTATIPDLRKFSNRTIQQMKEELNKRSVKEWHLVDPEDLRRRRFIKQMF